MIDWMALVWLGSSITLMSVAAIGSINGFGDLRALGNASNGRRMIAKDLLYVQLGRLLIGFGWTFLGLTVAFDDRVTPVSEGVLILVASNIVLTALAVRGLYTRRRLVR